MGYDGDWIEVQGARVPAIGLGTWQLRGEECRTAVRTALELGYRHLDTAEAYGNEEEVGRAIRESGVAREDVFITTKVGFENLAPSALTSACEGSLRRLDTTYVDLLLVHWPNPEVPLRHTLRAMERLRKHGSVRRIGVSNFPPGMLADALSLGSVVCDQIEMHPYLVSDRLLAMTERHAIFLTAYSPLARGRVVDEPVLIDIGRHHDKSASQVALRYLLQLGHVAAIPKARSRAHLESNLRVFDFTLSADEMKTIRSLGRGLRLIDPAFGPDWGEDEG